MKAGMLTNPQAYLKNLPDPRRETKNKLHKLEDIVMIVMCLLLSGIPSRDTLSAVLGRLNPAMFSEQFTAWVDAALSSPWRASTSPSMVKHSEVALGNLCI